MSRLVTAHLADGSGPGGLGGGGGGVGWPNAGGDTGPWPHGRQQRRRGCGAGCPDGRKTRVSCQPGEAVPRHRRRTAGPWGARETDREAQVAWRPDRCGRGLQEAVESRETTGSSTASAGGGRHAEGRSRLRMRIGLSQLKLWENRRKLDRRHRALRSTSSVTPAKSTKGHPGMQRRIFGEGSRKIRLCFRAMTEVLVPAEDAR